METEKLYKNKARCLKCNDVIESMYRHDFVRCKCGNIFVDGGLDYMRAGFVEPDTFEVIKEEILDEADYLYRAWRKVRGWDGWQEK